MIKSLFYRVLLVALNKLIKYLADTLELPQWERDLLQRIVDAASGTLEAANSHQIRPT